MAQSSSEHRISRRSLLRGTMVGAGAITLPALLTACGGGPGNEVKIGSNASDAVPRKAFDEVFKAYEKKSDNRVRVDALKQQSTGRPIDNVVAWTRNVYARSGGSGIVPGWR